MRNHDSLRDARSYASEVENLQAQAEAMRHYRDDAIRASHAAGETIAELSRATGLTRTMLYKIIEKNRATG